jgi:hypothetical protein
MIVLCIVEIRTRGTESNFGVGDQKLNIFLEVKNLKNCLYKYDFLFFLKNMHNYKSFFLNLVKGSIDNICTRIMINVLDNTRTYKHRHE